MAAGRGGRRQGNRAQYRYKTDDDAATGGTNRYIEKIRYGNYFPAPQADQAYAYELVFDYGEYALDGLSRPGADPMRRRAPGPSGPTRFPASAAVSRSAPGACAVACSLS